MTNQQRSIYVAQSNVLPGRQAEFDDWYNAQHIPDLLRAPGFLSAQRFRAAPVDRRPSVAAFSELAIYEIVGDPNEAFAALDRARTGGRIVSPGMAPGNIAHVFSQITPRIEARDGQ